MTMRRIETLWKRLHRTVRSEPSDVEFQCEIEEHVRLLAERYRGQGMTSDSAIQAARQQV